MHSKAKPQQVNILRRENVAKTELVLQQPLLWCVSHLIRLNDAKVTVTVYKSFVKT